MFTIDQQPQYDPQAVEPMRRELVDVGIGELLTPEAVDTAISGTAGTLFVVINSVCGCAAGSARPAVGLALQHRLIPDRSVTVFAGQDKAAVARVRHHLPGLPPSSPSMALFEDGRVVWFMPRHEIEGRSADDIAAQLAGLFEKHCTRTGPSIPADAFAELEFAKVCGSRIPRLHPHQ